jgi:hypothetical protein
MLLQKSRLRLVPFILFLVTLTFSTGMALAINAPTDLVARSTNDSTITLTWTDKSATETGFQIWRKAGAGVYELLATTGPNVKKYIDAAATNNRTTTSYAYYLQACKDAVCSPATSEVLVPNPNTVTLTVLGPQVNLEWKDDSSQNSVTTIERKEGSCPNTSAAWTPLMTTGTNTTSYSDKDIVAGSTYSYRLKATYQSPSPPYAKGYSGYTGCKGIAVSSTAPPGAVILPETGQKTCYDVAGNIIGCGFTGQDGAMQAGQPWPNPRFISGTDAEAECMIDALTGLMWPKNGAVAFNTMPWQQALDYANNFDLCGHTDWRMPNINELASLLNKEEPNLPFWLTSQGFNSMQNSYWSSSTAADSPGYAWGVLMSFSAIYNPSKASSLYVWPVRSAGPGPWGSPAIELPKTGQTKCYEGFSPFAEIDCNILPGQDGDIQAGVAWPNPRFVSGTGAESDCIKDRLTGLMWLKNGNPGRFARTWQQALDFAKSSYCGHTDWRLPNVNELRSLVNVGEADTASWLNTQGFYGIRSYFYWSSNTAALSTSNAWLVDMWGGFSNFFNGPFPYPDEKNDLYYGWIVRSRSGQP